MNTLPKITPFQPHLNGYYDTENQLPAYLIRRTERLTFENDAAKAGITTTAAFEARRDEVRRRFIGALGGLEFEKTPLNPVETGSFDFEGFTLHKVYYESRPRFYVTASLFVPHGTEKPSPAVLMACGHSADGKACDTYQQVAIDLANNGLIVLLVDPVGQGERVQYDRFKEDGTPEIGYCTMEHTYSGQQWALTGGNIAGVMMWDLIRSFDYLASLPIVDENRIGMTGNSGGGTQTEYMMCCEPRLACAMPCCYTTAKLEYMKTGQIHDAEQNVCGVIANRIDYDDLISCMAPKPVRIGTARFDFFCIEGAMKTKRRAEKMWSLYGKADDLSIFTTDATHGFSVGLRQSAVNFFRRYLLGLDESFVADPDRSIFTQEQLRVTKSGFIVKDFPDMESVWSLCNKRLDQVKYSGISDRADLKKRVETLLNMPQYLTQRDEIRYPRVIADSVTGGVRVRKLFFFTEEDITCAGILLEKADAPSKNVTIYCTEDGTEGIADRTDEIASLLEHGSVFFFDPRGVGAVKARGIHLGTTVNPYGVIYDNYYKLNCDAVMLGTSLCALRVFDMIRASDLMKGFFGFDLVSYAGRDYAAFDAMCAAALTDMPVTVSGNVPAFEDIVRQRYFPSTPRNYLHGILTLLDTPTMIKLLNADVC